MHHCSFQRSYSISSRMTVHSSAPSTWSDLVLIKQNELSDPCFSFLGYRCMTVRRLYHCGVVCGKRVYPLAAEVMLFCNIVLILLGGYQVHASHCSCGKFYLETKNVHVARRHRFRKNDKQPEGQLMYMQLLWDEAA